MKNAIICNFEKTLTMKTTLLFLFGILSTSLFGQQLTYVPDDVFEQVLIDLGYDDVLDDYVMTSNISGVNYIDLTNLQITDLTGIEDFTVIEVLTCNDNQLTSLDLSNNGSLIYFECLNNQLYCLNIKNGNNINMYGFWAANNLLTCIEVDYAAYSSANWTGIDSQTSFSENCNYPSNCFTTSLTELNSSKILIQILDLMGRETTFKPNTPLIYVYDDGSTEKVFSVEY